MTVEGDIAVVGSGVSGLLAARASLAAGRRVVMLERGALKTHAEALRDGNVSADVPGAEPNHETAPAPTRTRGATCTAWVARPCTGRATRRASTPPTSRCARGTA